MSTTPLPWKPQSQANTADAPVAPGGTPVQFDGQVVALANGGYVVAWEDRSRTYDPSGATIVGQLYDAQGQAVGGETTIDVVLGNVTSPALAALPGGGIVLAYQASNNIFVGVRGADMSDERFDTIETGPDPSSNPAITTFSGGSYVVAYEIESGTDTLVVARRASPNGDLGAQFEISRGSEVDLATLSNGNFVAVYQDRYLDDPLDTQIEYRIFTAAGNAVGGMNSRLVTGGSDIGLAEHDPDVAALTGGGFVVVWTDDSGNASGERIRATLLDNAGNDIRSNVIINTHDTGHQNEASVVGLDDGGFLVTWEDDFADLVRAQRFDAFGNMVGTEFIVHQGVAPGSPDAAVLNDGRVAYAISDDATGDLDVATSIWDPRPPQGPANVLWQHAEGSPALSDNVLSVFATTELIRGTGDFDGDGDADLLWHRDSGSVVAWTIQDGAYLGDHILGNVPGNWQIRGTGDFDADGDADIVWHHDAGLVVTWEMENGLLVTNHNQSDVPNTWRMVGTGDFDGDADADLVWRHVDGQMVIWEMQGGNYVVNHNLDSVTNNWQVRGTDDFDGDGDADILWHHVSGLVVTWEMEDGAYVTNHNIESAGGGWRIRGAGDLDDDGDADILWRHNDGTVVAWEIEDGAYVTNHNYGLIPDGWQIRGIGDFDLA